MLILHDMLFAGGSATDTALVKAELEYQIKRLSHHPSIAMFDGCNECGGGGSFEDFVMPTVAAVDPSRPIWPSCPATGWSTGVERISSRPDGEELRVGPGGANQTTGQMRPAGYPFPLEAHGPYGAFLAAADMSDRVLPRACPQIPIGGAAGPNHPVLVPANLGVAEAGWFRSEFGVVSWPSFESIAVQMPRDQWSLLSQSAKNRNWSPANVIFRFFGAAAAAAMTESGEQPFKRQLYQSMIGQALFLKTEVEAWRSQNLFGSLVWMYACLHWPLGCYVLRRYGACVFVM
eukprot:COSAG06_NODE_4105_length_4571_cov_3.031977_2_plen_290_part_00